MEKERIQFSHHDIRRELKLPAINEDLAYFCGLLAGDGYISLKEYDISCSGNPNDEVEFYDYYVKNLIKSLFNLDAKMKYLRGGKSGLNGTYGFKFGSKALSNFLVNHIGLPSGKKYSSLKIPEVFRKDNLLKLNFIRGLVDTDFGFTLKKKYRKEGYYPVITFCSRSTNFLNEIYKELEIIGLSPTKPYTIVTKDERIKSGYNVINMFDINGNKQLLFFASKIGFRHPKHFKKLEVWKERNKNKRMIASGGFEFGSNHEMETSTDLRVMSPTSTPDCSNSLLS